ncbi:hypothetical protein MTQ10_04850 [Streptomyces sp. XM83C]|jgi:hypothetical protein|uniref:Uncharacterized protein n=1 Tax=Streptomyces thermocoprophilus TaxID=78356 RepID=A0ABV5VGG9_9ACTN|nr:hypothetical protein [Streptomyces sp. XM83C]MCK1818951.1 hypothetical protein [Streptomyces sp. XM83C]
MAKNKNRDRKQPQSRRASGPGEQTMTIEPPAEQHSAPGSPTEMARKGRQKRFGHN